MWGALGRGLAFAGAAMIAGAVLSSVTLSADLSKWIDTFVRSSIPSGSDRSFAVQYLAAMASVVQAGTGLLTLLVSTVGAVFLFLTWRDARRTVKATEASAKAAQDTLAVSQRPWLKLEVQPAGPLAVSNGGSFRLGVRLQLENLGTAPATEVRTFAQMQLGPPEQAVAVANSLIDVLVRDPKKRAGQDEPVAALFPGGKPWYAKKSLESSVVRAAPGTLQSAAALIVVACVEYRTSGYETPRRTFIAGLYFRVQDDESRLSFFDFTKAISLAVNGSHVDYTNFPSSAD